MVSYLSVVFCAIYLIGVVLQSEQCGAEQQLIAEPSVELNPEGLYDDPEIEEKRGGGRYFVPNGEKRGGGRSFGFAPMSVSDKRGGGRYFVPNEDKRAGGRSFGFAPMSLSDKRAGGRGFSSYDSMEKRAGGRAFAPMAEKRAGGRAFYGYGSLYPSYPLVYKKDYVPYYFENQYKRGGGRAFSGSA